MIINRRLRAVGVWELPERRDEVVALLRAGRIDVVADAPSAPAAQALTEHPDLVIVDAASDTAVREALELAEALRARRPPSGTLVLAGELDEELAMRIVRESPRGLGYVRRGSVTGESPLTLVARRVAEGGTVVDAGFVRELAARGHAGEALLVLSPTEYRVLALMAEGLSNNAIASYLEISKRTVEAHARSILGKLGIPDHPDVNRRVRAVLTFLQARAGAGAVARAGGDAEEGTALAG